MASDKELVALHARKPELEASIKSITDAIAKLHGDLAKVRAEYGIVRAVTDIVDGVCLYVDRYDNGRWRMAQTVETERPFALSASIWDNEERFDLILDKLHPETSPSALDKISSERKNGLEYDEAYRIAIEWVVGRRGLDGRMVP